MTRLISRFCNIVVPPRGSFLSFPRDLGVALDSSAMDVMVEISEVEGWLYKVQDSISEWLKNTGEMPHVSCCPLSDARFALAASYFKISVVEQDDVGATAFGVPLVWVGEGGAIGTRDSRLAVSLAYGKT